MIITNIFVEFLGTLAIVFVFLVSNGNPLFTGVVFTSFLFLSGSLGGQGQLNPAISFAQILSSGNSSQNVLNLLAQILGAFVGIFAYKISNIYG